MILVAISWGWIGITSFLLGFAVMEGIGKITGNEEFCGLELYSLMGLMCLTIYSQIYSLFSGVGGMATLLLGMVSILVFVVLRKAIGRYAEHIYTIARKRILPCFLILFIILLGIYVTAGRTWHYDTDLYHAQAIRWIEEYGVVKGLGNLHNRFAYNSAFSVCRRCLA